MKIACALDFGPNTTFKDTVIWLIKKIKLLIARVEKKIQRGKGDITSRKKTLVFLRGKLQQLEEMRDGIDE